MAIGLGLRGRPRSDAAVVFAADGNYLRFAAFAAAQIAGAARRSGASTSASARRRSAAPAAGLGGLGVRHLPGRHRRRSSPGCGLDPRRTEAAYLRLALPAAFAGEYRRLLYLDADVFVQGGDFAALLDVDIGAASAGRGARQHRSGARRGGGRSSSGGSGSGRRRTSTAGCC